MPHMYTYIVLQHQPSLEFPTAENFAILVEGRAPNGWVVFAVGRSPGQQEKLSAVGTAIAQQFPDVLTRILNQALETKVASEGVLDRVRTLMMWNFRASSPKTFEDEDSIDRVGFKLFSQYVAHANDLLLRVNPHSGPIQQTHTGETFAAAIPVPEPTPELFATA